VVVALKSRTAPPAQAVRESLAALAWLRAAGARQVFFKYCSTFDSTEQGNIGPVADALVAALDAEHAQLREDLPALWNKFNAKPVMGKLGAAVAAAQEPQYFEEPAAKPKFSLRWDFLARYDHIDHWHHYEPISRGRFELRPQIGVELFGNLEIAVRGVFDYGTEENFDNALYGDNSVSRGAYVDRYFALWTPGAWTVQAGAFPLPVAASEMLWDKYDIMTPGAGSPG